MSATAVDAPVTVERSRGHAIRLALIALATVGITLLAGSAVAGVLLTDGPVPVKATTPRAALTQSASDAGPLGCSVYGIPSLDSPAIARSTMSEGLPYVIVCDDADGVEVLNAVFVHHLGQ